MNNQNYNCDKHRRDYQLCSLHHFLSYPQHWIHFSPTIIIKNSYQKLPTIITVIDFITYEIKILFFI